MAVNKKFDSLNGKEVSRKYLKSLINEAKKENNTEVIFRVSKILLDNPKSEKFIIDVIKYPNSLNAPRHTGIYKEALTECGRLRKGWRFEKGIIIGRNRKTRAIPQKKSKTMLPNGKPKKGLDINGKLKKGYKYAEGGKIVKVTATKKKNNRRAKRTKV